MSEDKTTEEAATELTDNDLEDVSGGTYCKVDFVAEARKHSTTKTTTVINGKTYTNLTGC